MQHIIGMEAIAADIRREREAEHLQRERARQTAPHSDRGTIVHPLIALLTALLPWTR